MADEQQAIAESGQETATAAPAQITVDEPERIPGPEEVSQQQDEPAEIEEIEIDWDDGKKYRIPKVLEGGILKNKDYTQGKQKIAETRKQLESREAEINQRLQATDDELDMRAELKGVTRRLEEYSKLTAEDWAAHRRSLPLQTDDAWTEYQLLKEQKASLAEKLTAAATTRTAEAERQIATRVQETMDFAKEKIPGFKPEMIDQVVQFLDGQGYSEEEIKQNWSPRFFEMSFHGMLGKALIAKQNAAKNPLPGPKVEPLTTVNGKFSPGARVDLASADMEAYVAARKAGVGGKPLR